MRKMKRIIALITVAMFVLSFAAPTFAAEPVAKTAIGKDVKGTKYEGDAKKLISLGIINGFEDGTVRPESTVTRAQFAAIVAQELGMAAGVQQSPTKFKDVPASHWASGVINLAVGRGIIVGYPDGSFKPEAPVTYAEAYAMIVQMLGYGPTIKGAAWPAGVLAKAASLGVSKGVTGAAGTAMKRGDVIIAAANALEIDIMEQDEWGDSAVYKKQDKTILSEVFDITIYNDTFKNEGAAALGYLEVKDVPMVNLSGLDADEIKLGTLVYTLSPVYNPNEFLGQNVEAWINTDDKEVVFIAGSDDETVINDTIDDVDGDEIALKDADEEYTILEDAKVWVNIDEKGEYGDEFDSADLLARDGAYIKVVLNDDEEVIAAVILDWNDGISGLAKEVKVADEIVKYYTETGSTGTLDMEDDDYAIVKDGVPAQLSDINEFDVINVLEGTDEYYIAVTSTQAKGAADVSWSSDANVENLDVEVGDTKYDVNADATYSDDANENIEALTVSDLKDLNGEEVTLYLDAMGDVRHIVSGEVDSASSDLIGVVTKTARYNDYDDEVKFTIVNKAGTEMTFEFDPDDVEYDGDDRTGAYWEGLFNIADADDETRLQVIEYKLDSAGKLTEVNPFDEVFESDITVDINEDDKTIGLGNGDFSITDNTVIFDVTGAVYASSTIDEIDDVKIATWDSIKSKNSVKAAVVVDDDNVKYMFVVDAGVGGLTSEGEYAVVTGFTTVGGDDAVKLLLADGTKSTIVYEGADVDNFVYNDGNDPVVRGMVKGDFIRYELNSDDEIENVDILATTGIYSHLTGAQGALDIDNIYNATVVESSSSSIKAVPKGGSETRYTINSDTKFFEIFDTDKLKQVSSVDEEATVVIIDTDDDNRTADYVIVVSEDSLF